MPFLTTPSGRFAYFNTGTGTGTGTGTDTGTGTGTDTGTDTGTGTSMGCGTSTGCGTGCGGGSGTGTGMGCGTSTGCGTGCGGGSGTGTGSGSGSGSGESYMPATELNGSGLYGSMYCTWTPGGSPSAYTVYLEQSIDEIEWTNYTNNESYTTDTNFYSLAGGYYYRFYVASHYPGPTRVDSSYSPSYLVYGAEYETGTGSGSGSGSGTGTGSGESYMSATGLSLYIGGDTAYCSWTTGGSPDSYTVYLEQSSDQYDWPIYTSSSDLTTTSTEFYSLPQGFYYRFTVLSIYSGIGVNSDYSSAEYVFYI